MYIAYANKRLNLYLSRAFTFRTRYLTKQLNYGNDIEMVNVLVGKALTDHIHLNYLPIESTRVDLNVTDEMLKEDSENLSISVYTKLNTEYINYLCTFYFKDEVALQTFIYEMILSGLMKAALTTNLSKAKK